MEVRRWGSKWILGIMIAGACAAGDGVSTRRFAGRQAAAPFILGGGEFTARGDSERISIRREAPPADASLPFSNWNNGVPHAFKIVHNAGGITGISIDDVFTTVSPVTIDPGTNGLMLTTFADLPGLEVRLSNLKLTRPGFIVSNVSGMAKAPPEEVLIVKTKHALSAGFILSGQVTFSWEGPRPPAANQWFELSPVRYCEPCDVNCDGSVNLYDTPAMVHQLTWPYPQTCSPCAGDTNFNGTVNAFDIQGFVECVEASAE